jgi:serine/threonine protein kinase
LFAFMLDKVNSGFVDGVPRCAGRPIGRGSTSVVLERTGGKTGVLKVASGASTLNRERHILQHIGGVGRTLQVHDDDTGNHKVLCLSERLHTFSSFCSTDSESLVHQLRVLHREKQVVHCDISWRNILQRRPGGGYVLVDFGAARLTSDRPAVFQHGSITTASDRVLAAIERHLPIAPTPTDDMVSFGRCMLMRLSVAQPPRNAVVSQIVAHWQAVEREISFARFAKACRQDPPNYNKVLEELRALTGTGGDAARMRLDAEGNGGVGGGGDAGRGC